MKTIRAQATVLAMMAWDLRYVLWMGAAVWWGTRGLGATAAAGHHTRALWLLVGMVTLDVATLRRKVRDLEAPPLEEQARRMVRERRKAGA